MKEVSIKPVTALQNHAATFALTSAALFVLLLGVLHVIEPEFTPTWRFVSEYQLGAYGWMMHLAFIALAASLAATGVALWSQAKGWLGHIGNVILWIAALGLCIAGIFTTDPITTAVNALSAHGNMHVFGASLDYTPIAMLLLSFSLARTPAWRPARTALFVTGLVSFIMMIAFIFALPKDGIFNANVYAGLVGRLLLVSYVGWIYVVFRHMTRRQK